MKLKARGIFIFILLVIIIIWIIWGNITIGVSNYQVSSNRIPKSFDHYKVAVVSDFHNSNIDDTDSEKEYGKLSSLIANENPDIIAITGDLVDSRKTDIKRAQTLVKKLLKIAPCYYVNGNHEANIGEAYKELERKLRTLGVTVLRNSYVQLEKGGEQIIMCGVDDPNFVDSDSSVQEEIMRESLSKINFKGDYRILLSHRPELFDVYVDEGEDLVLSGHAHGGQFRIPFIGGIVAPNQGFFPKYDGGLYEKNKTKMIVSRGIGNSIIPVRFNNRPELVVVELISSR